MGVAGLERAPYCPEKTGFFAEGDAESDAMPPDLPEIAAELRSRLTVAECRQLANLLLAGEGVSR